MPALKNEGGRATLALRGTEFEIWEMHSSPDDPRAPTIELLDESGQPLTGRTSSARARIRCAMADLDRGPVTVQLRAAGEKQFELGVKLHLQIADVAAMRDNQVTLPLLAVPGWRMRPVARLSAGPQGLVIERIVGHTGRGRTAEGTADTATASSLTELVAMTRNRRTEERLALPKHNRDITLDASASTARVSGELEAVADVLSAITSGSCSSGPEGVAVAGGGADRVLVTDLPPSSHPHPTVVVCDRSMREHFAADSHIFCLDTEEAHILSSFRLSANERHDEAMRLVDSLIEFLVDLEA
ncbi:MAG: hypothetical protein Q4P33_06360 [Flaviflexus sp.]|nr:hypothetical protein [Flaviflexus sp.]